MSEFDIGIVGDRRIETVFAQFPEAVRGTLRAAIGDIIAELEGRVLAGEPHRTGRLQSETRPFVDERADFIRGRVRVVTNGAGSSEGGKAAALEYGAHRSTAIKAYTRTVTTVFGHYVGPTEQLVGAYSRHANIAARRYLRGPLDEMKTSIVARLQAALSEAASHL